MEVNGYRVYYIEQYLTSDGLIRMVRKSTAKKIALVIPEKQLIFIENYNLKLLKKFLDRTGKEIVFISNDKNKLNELQQTGFKVFEDLNNLEKKDEYDKDKIEKKNNRAYLSKHSILMMLIVLSIIILAGVYFLYPTVIIKIEPATQLVEKEIFLKGSLVDNKVSWEEKIVPLHKFEIELKSQKNLRATGMQKVGIKKAEGKVKLINENKNEVIIPKGTIVMTEDKKKFQTVKEVVIPPLSVDYLMEVPVGMRAGQVEVNIEALVKGIKGNVGTGDINSFLHPKEKVYVVNPEPTIGGTNDNVLVVAQEDIEGLKDELEKEMKNRVLNEVYKKMGGNFHVLENNISYKNLDFKIDSKVGDRKKYINGKGELLAIGYLLRNSELNKLCIESLKSKVQNNLSIIEKGLNIDEIKLEKVNKKLYNIKLTLQAVVIPDIKKDSLVKKITGKNIDNAIEILENNDFIDNFTIQGNGHKLPDLKYAIKLNITEPDTVSVFKEIREK